MGSSPDAVNLSKLKIGQGYSRADVATIGGVRLPRRGRDSLWLEGIVEFSNAALLFVTLDKSERPDYAYEDRFEGALFWWQSQNRQSPNDDQIKGILADTKPVHLFVRTTEKQGKATRPFIYCGRLGNPIAEGSNPVTCLFDSLDYVDDADGELREIYDWRPLRTPSRTSIERQATVRARKPRQGKGQGWQIDPEVRRATDSLAMRVAQSHYEALKYAVEDTHLNRPYDFVVTLNSDVRRVEVKGTTGLGDSVILTANEVSAARKGPEPTDLFIVHSITVVKESDSVKASGGEVRLLPNWTPRNADLNPTEYRYSVPTARGDRGQPG
jgi:Domain of unknown function (DUF3427)/Domain of unknown function (DUF3883)